MIDANDVLEIVVVSAKTTLLETHAKLVAHESEFAALIAGHTLTVARRADLMLTLERWDDERLWFTVDNRGGITLAQICDAAGTTVGIVRAFFQEWLIVPFNFKLAYSHLSWESENVREFCRVCASARCEKAQARVHNEGGETREGVAGSYRFRLKGADSVHRTEETGRASNPPAKPDRKTSP